jgi:hypothetical protein
VVVTGGIALLLGDFASGGLALRYLPIDPA